MTFQTYIDVFNYGVQYSWILVIFSVTISFSVAVPLIAPFGNHLFFTLSQSQTRLFLHILMIVAYSVRTLFKLKKL